MQDNSGEELWSSGQVNGHQALYLMMGEVRQKLLGLCDDVADLTHDTHQQFHNGHDRMDKHEALILEIHGKLNGQGRFKSFCAAALAVMPLKEWLVALVLGVMVLKGLVSPSDVKAVLLSLLKAGE